MRNAAVILALASIATAHAAPIAPAYQLEDGRVIKFTEGATTYYTQLKGETRVRMYARGPGVYETRDGTRIEFRDDGETVAIRHLERLPMTVAMRDDGRVHVAKR